MAERSKAPDSSWMGISGTRMSAWVGIPLLSVLKHSTTILRKRLKHKTTFNGFVVSLMASVNQFACLSNKTTL